MRTWSKDEILYAILEWEEANGRPPGCNDWLHSGGDAYPSFTTVTKKFGKWNNAIREAGLEPRPAHTTPQFSHQEARRLRKLGISDMEIGRRLGVRGGAVAKALGPRPKPKPVSRNRSREQRIDDLKKALMNGNDNERV